MRSVAATIFCLVAFAASGGASVAEAHLPPTYDFILVFERSGGLAPSTQSLVVAPGGVADVTSNGTRAGRHHARFRLGNARIRSLQRGLRRANFRSIHGRPEESCADCYVYSIFYEGTYLKLDESEVSPRLGEVIGEIEAIITAHTVSPDARSAQR